MYAQILFETGIVGLILFIIFIRYKYLYSKRNIVLQSSLIGVLLAGIGLDVIRTRYFWTILFLINIYTILQDRKYKIKKRKKLNAY